MLQCGVPFCSVHCPLGVRTPRPGGWSAEIRHSQFQARKVWLAAPEGFLGDGAVSGVRAIHMHLGLPDRGGRQAVTPIAGGHSTMPTDLAVKALGFDAADLPRIFNEPELELTRWGTLKVNQRTFETSLPDVFAAGDIVRGASLVVWAIRDGREAAAAIHRHLERRARLPAAVE
jgi:glutamate synthase (NADPH) small chain